MRDRQRGDKKKARRREWLRTMCEAVAGRFFEWIVLVE